VFTPAPDANGASYDSFDFTVHDGTEYSASTNTITFDVTATQDAPTAADKTITIDEDTSHAFAAADFGFGDVDGDSLTKIQITTLESAGTLKLSGADVTVGQEILVADIGNLVFTPAQDANGTSYDSFDFKVHDGTEYSATANTITFDVTAVNDAPTAADQTVTIDEDTSHTFTAADFGFSDVDGDSLTKIQITTLESAGTLKLSGADVTAGQEILVGDLGNLVFTPVPDANGIVYDSFQFRVHDGTEFSSLPYTMVVDVDAIQDAPTAADRTVTATEDTAFTFSAADFGFSDVDAGDSLTKIQITSLESNGTLTLAGADVTLDQEILVADIGNLVFTPAPGVTGTGYDAFDFKVHDGTEYSASDYTLTIDVVPANTAPVVDAGPGQTVDEGDVVTLTATASDVDGQPLSYAWTQVSGPAVVLDDAGVATPTFTAPEGLVNSDLVFRLDVSDGIATSSDTVTITVNADDDAPSVSAVSAPSAMAGDFVDLSATAVDPEGQGLTFQWIQLSGPPVTLVDANGSTAWFQVPIDFGDASLQFQVSVSDGANTSVTTVALTVQAAASTEPPAEPPTEPPDPIATPDPTDPPDPTDEPTVEVDEPTLPPDPFPEPEDEAPELPSPTQPDSEPEPASPEPPAAEPAAELEGGYLPDESDADDTAAMTTTESADVAASMAGDFVELAPVDVDAMDLDQPITWRQIGGTRVELSDANSAKPIFQAPELLVPEELVFEVTTIRNGEPVTETVSIVVEPVETFRRPEGYALADWDHDRDGHADQLDDDGGPSERGLFGALLATLFSFFRIHDAERDRS
jgi:hypothetical protein